jgi:hypothetical protein
MNETIKNRAIETGIRNVPRLRDQIIAEFGREAMRVATVAGLGEELSAGISASLKNLFKREEMNGGDEHPDFSSICPGFEDLRPAYFVPSRGEYVKTTELVTKLRDLDDARKHLWTKIAESRAEAEKLDRVYEFLARRSDGTN